MTTAFFGGFTGVELARAPGELCVVDALVINVVVAKRREQVLVNAAKQIALEDQVVITQRQDVGLIRPVGYRRQPQQEARCEVIQQTVLGWC
ncbi:hypothetical protein [Allohahella marinimesophila]|uniref:hypothetical protein n=1 Tax=Allohahella marinimesophila TaxID=1054972 RepID=UPI0031D0061E